MLSPSSPKANLPLLSLIHVLLVTLSIQTPYPPSFSLEITLSALTVLRHHNQALPPCAPSKKPPRRRPHQACTNRPARHAPEAKWCCACVQFSASSKASQTLDLSNLRMTIAGGNCTLS